jgi:hypothetical protein
VPARPDEIGVVVVVVVVEGVVAVVEGVVVVVEGVVVVVVVEGVVVVVVGAGTPFRTVAAAPTVATGPDLLYAMMLKMCVPFVSAVVSKRPLGSPLN